MNNVKLVSPQPEHEKLWQNIVEEFKAQGEKIIPYALKFDCENYTDFLNKTAAFSSEESTPKHLVTASTYFLMNAQQDKILGAVNIRHKLNENLLKVGGHIGYGVAPSSRRCGYASKMLAMALEKCRELGLEKVLVTCDKNNIASAKTILSNGGVLENEITEDSGNIVQRYWIGL